jgi:hypothetical protein
MLLPELTEDCDEGHTLGEKNQFAKDFGEKPQRRLSGGLAETCGGVTVTWLGQEVGRKYVPAGLAEVAPGQAPHPWGRADQVTAKSLSG